MKDLAVAKQRLSGMLSTGERRHLSLEMLLDVITTLKQVDGLDTVAVISRDPHVMDLARTWNVRVFQDTESCVNAALAVTARILSTEGCETMLVVPGDVPLTTPAEIEKILETRDTGFPVTLVPDRRRTGTNGLRQLGSKCRRYVQTLVMRRLHIRQIARDCLLPQHGGIEHSLHALVVGAGKKAVNHASRAAIIVP